MKAAILTAGCRLNQSESDSLRAMLSAQGTVVVEDGVGVDVCYINTCAVTAAAERSSVQLIRQAARLRPKPRVVVLGCMVERVPHRAAAIPGVDEVWDNAVKRSRIADYGPRPVRSRAFLKIQDGCDNRCSYCIVSSLRGTPWSMTPEEVARRCDRLAAEGFQEVTLTGLNLGTYRSAGLDVAGLLEFVLSHSGLASVRLGSLEPDALTDRLQDVMSDERVCPHLHVPLQSGDDVILSRMGRYYGVADVARRLDRILRVRPDVNIGADVIAGFPGEDDESFERTMARLEQLPFGYLHVFSFSARPGTHASGMTGTPGSGAVKRRVRLLRELSARLLNRYAGRFVGSTRPAIVETRNCGLTDNYLKVRLDVGDLPAPRSRIRVRLGVKRGTLTGEYMRIHDSEAAEEAAGD